MKVPADVKPKKRLGQHFLIDPNIARKILATAQLEPHHTVLEIGPGCGALTEALCESVSRVIALEIDKDLAESLKQTLNRFSNLEIHRTDALQFPYVTLPKGTVVVANLPYNVSTPLLFQLLKARAYFQRMVLMLQYEVAQRIVAKPGTRDYGALSVIAQCFSKPQKLFAIAPTCFRPRPKVESAVVRFDFLDNPSCHPLDETAFIRIVRGAFAHRRKTLVNSFRDERYSSSDIKDMFGKTDISMVRRAETLSVDEFVALAKAFTILVEGSSQSVSSRSHTM